MKINFKKIRLEDSPNEDADYENRRQTREWEKTYNEYLSKYPTDDITDAEIRDTINHQMKYFDNFWKSINKNYFENNEELPDLEDQLFMSGYVRYCASKDGWVLEPVSNATLIKFQRPREEKFISRKLEVYSKGYFEWEHGERLLCPYSKPTQKAIDFCEKYLSNKYVLDESNQENQNLTN